MDHSDEPKCRKGPNGVVLLWACRGRQGVRDFGPFVKKDFDDDMLVREEAFSIIRSIFKRHGAKEIGEHTYKRSGTQLDHSPMI